ncbi:MAG: sensor histidine kinase, partial [Candidatus Sericytochromatia bacterium]
MEKQLLDKDILDSRLNFIIKGLRENENSKYISELNNLIKEQNSVICKLKESEKNLLELNSFKDKLFSIVAHDLRSPISNIKTFLSFMLEDEDTTLEEIKDILGNFGHQIDGTLDIIDNLLRWSYSQINSAKLCIENVNLHDVVNSVIKPIKVRFKNKIVHIQNEIPVDFYLDLDKDIISTVLRNLISNSVKFTNSDGFVKITAEKITKNKFEIKVIDNGIGMTKEEISHLFKKEKVNSKKGTNNEKGIGLGLLICKEFLEIHNSEISVKSKVNQGSEFK